jgi:hypothetical protein
VEYQEKDESVSVYSSRFSENSWDKSFDINKLETVSDESISPYPEIQVLEDSQAIESVNLQNSMPEIDESQVSPGFPQSNLEKSEISNESRKVDSFSESPKISDENRIGENAWKVEDLDPEARTGNMEESTETYQKNLKEVNGEDGKVMINKIGESKKDDNWVSGLDSLMIFEAKPETKTDQDYKEVDEKKISKIGISKVGESKKEDGNWISGLDSLMNLEAKPQEKADGG